MSGAGQQRGCCSSAVGKLAVQSAGVRHGHRCDTGIDSQGEMCTTACARERWIPHKGAPNRGAGVPQEPKYGTSGDGCCDLPATSHASGVSCAAGCVQHDRPQHDWGGAQMAPSAKGSKEGAQQLNPADHIPLRYSHAVWYGIRYHIAS